ncbi:MAG: winged helix-turn-helix domain-containing protein [Nanoarchaeota archaeon]|nr:winged helix-turn-helix domain-containing protein [Nanoarchaeota archaeon]MBU4451651.1 winged helix-turn-helix domain-containing protein [Nanoarchaeota archaeon]MCG2723638.1 winged helix-turn-helix domain-containing protein [archaeon]
MADESSFVDSSEYFGASAGKVWSTLKTDGTLNVLELSRKAKLKTTDVIGALGWLAREGKITIKLKNRTAYYELIEK